MRGEFIDLDGERIYYYAAGTRGAGDPIVLIHGFPTSSHVWVDVVAKLPPGHRVIVVDLLGFGRSDAPVGADYSVAGHGRRLLLLLDALRIDHACVVGQDVGGAIALWLRVHGAGRVTRLGLVGEPSARPKLAGSRLLALLLRFPAWCWMPMMRRAIAAQYADAERGHRSAEIFLMRFAAEGGGDLLHRHLRALDDAQTATVGQHAATPTIPTISFDAGPRCFPPEEAPSDVAAAIAGLFAR
jgi:pimeloyl-ACP methyl ester carboxylesterase